MSTVRKDTLRASQSKREKDYPRSSKILCCKVVAWLDTAEFVLPQSAPSPSGWNVWRILTAACWTFLKRCNLAQACYGCSVPCPGGIGGWSSKNDPALCWGWSLIRRHAFPCKRPAFPFSFPNLSILSLLAFILLFSSFLTARMMWAFQHQVWALGYGGAHPLEPWARVFLASSLLHLCQTRLWS